MNAARRTRRSETRTFAAATATVNSARSFVAGYVRRCGGDDDLVARAELVASELASNAIEATSASDYQVRMSHVDPDSFAVAVSNVSGHARVPAASQWHPDAVLAEKGRGLFIVTELAARVEVDQTDVTTTVTAFLER